MKPVLIRWLFALTLGLFALQCVLVKVVGEPYPALIMPGFHGAGGYEDNAVEVSDVEVRMIADQQTYVFSRTEFLSAFTDSIHFPILNGFLSPLTSEPSQAAEPRSFLRRLRQQLIPRLYYGRRNRLDTANLRSLQQWIGQQTLRQKGIRKVEFHWFVETIRFANKRWERTRVPSGVFSVDLQAQTSW